jgi:ABC-2 type transport system ATP-binding protein
MVSAERLIKKFRPPASLRQLIHGRLRGEPVAALDGVSLTVERGEAFGLMGPNGAGKSTLLRILAGLVAPDGGHASVDGLDCARGGPRLGAKVGYLAADERGLTQALSPRELVAFYGALHGLRRAAALRRADELMEEVGLTAVARRPIGELSTGMRRRAGLARALLGTPVLLLLDEPTRGLDPTGALALRAQLRAALGRGVAMVMATHDLAEAQSLCRRVAVMAEGRFVAVETAEQAGARLLRAEA